jgi:hypothetical protein
LNLGLASSVASNQLTIALKQANGTDPAAGSGAVKVSFRNVASNVGLYSEISATSALSITVSAGSTLGMQSNATGFVYVYALNNSGVLELAVSAKIYDDGSLVSTTAEGGAGGADSGTLIYSATALSSVPVRLIGRLKVNQSTAGNWAASATEISVVPFLKGEVVSGSVTTERVERLTFGDSSTTNCTVSPCAYVRQSGNWVSAVTKTSTGNYTVSFSGFSSAPTCTCSAFNQGSDILSCSADLSTNTSSMNFYTRNASGVATNGYVHVICMGPK